MCGRFARYMTREERALLRDLERVVPPLASGEEVPPRWNIAPSQPVEVVRRNPETGALQTDLLAWGFVPRWTKDIATARRPINARAETIRSSSMFRDSFARRRCLVPMDAFYEWQGEKPPRRPWAVARRDGRPMLAGGVWDGWRAPDGAILRSVVVITTPANALLRPIHGRMPCVLAEADVGTWFGPDEEAAAALLRPAPEDALRAWPVGTGVNNIRNDGPALLQPREEPGAAAGGT